MEMFEPLFKGGYAPEPGTETMFVNPSFLKNKTSKRGVSQSGVSQSGGMGTMTILGIVAVVIYAMLRLSNDTAS
jgi:hypothetical protein